MLLTDLHKRLAAAALALATAAALVTTGVAQASTSAPVLVNPGFETGTLAGWTASSNYLGSGGPVQLYAGRTAPDGKYFAVVPGGCSTNTLKQQFTAVAGQTLRGWAFFQSNETSTSYNDTASVQLSVIGGGTAATVYTSSVKLVGGTGTTPWREWSYQFPAGGTYTIAASSTNVGDCLVPSMVGIDLATAAPDAAPPTVRASATSNGAPYTSGTWTNDDVLVRFDCTDDVGGSGVGSVTPEQIVSTEGAGQSVTGTCTDRAGNPASTTFEDIRIDKTAPVLDPAATSGGSPYTSGTWTNQDVEVTFTCADDAGGSGVGSVTPEQTVSTEGAGQSVTGTCTDRAGNPANATVAGIDIDKTAPTATFDAPDGVADGVADGGSYTWGSTPPAPGCSAADTLSGPDGCTVTGYSTAVGTHTLTATAKDVAGNTGTTTWTYTVEPWTTSGFYQPVNMGGVVNTVKNGSTVPVKFRVYAGDTEVVDTTMVTMSAARTDCTTGATDAIEITTTGATSLRYDPTAGQFVYNWSTPKSAGACFALTMTTADGTATKALFKLR